jgi:hypothetical protein
MNSVAPVTASNWRFLQASFASSMRSLRLETKFHQL